ncbi:MAG: peptidase domain-containing ABC transporter [Saprospiraceae bacterium]|nr:peptidase domain-containing ABC transporter [Saprospiraceae bacterium]
MGFKNYLQYDIMDCGPTCLKMVARHHGKTLGLDRLRELTKISRNGVSLFAISEAAEKIGYKTMGALVTYEQLKEEVTLPAIIHWSQNHFVVLYKITKKKVYVSDPASGNKTYTKEEFLKHWASVDEDGNRAGVVLIMEPTPYFYSIDEDPDESSIEGLKFLSRYFIKYKGEISYVFIAIAISSMLQFTFPFLTQAIVDKGINAGSYSIIFIILLAQFFLMVGRMFVEYVRSWFLLFINSRINVSILSDYLIKLMKLPISYFDTRRTGDILQRMNDHQRIQDFLTGPALELIFSIVTVIVLGITLIIYNSTIFFIFFIASALYIFWTVYLLKYNKILNFKRFELGAQNQTQTLQIINGIQDIKLNNSEMNKRWGWEKVQAKLFKLNIKYLRYNQIQTSGSFLINESKNLLITYIAAINVVNGNFTIGMMLAIQAIVGQLNGPISLLISLILSWHDTKLSLERLDEIRQMKDEEADENPNIRDLGEDKSIYFKNLSFSYPGTDEDVIDDVTITIPEGKTTAIVGASGSGKTTLIKLMLKYYEKYEGNISVGSNSLSNISPSFWRSQCGTVMQESFIFSDTIARNICLSDQKINYQMLNYAIENANITDFINSLPLGVRTKIGAEGVGISEGQKQRLLIARAIYKRPRYMFFDEATNSLDASNESIIVKNLERFFENRTVVVVAHRLSTVRNADNIIVMDDGEVIESGPHEELIEKKGAYYTLIKNQLELGA